MADLHRKERIVDSTTPASAIRELEDRRLLAMLAGDTATMEGLLADDFQYFHSSGARDTKTTYLAKVGSGMFSGLTASTSFEPVWVRSEAAFMRGKMVASAEKDGVRREFVNHPFAVWRRSDGRWQLLAYQVTPAPPG